MKRFSVPLLSLSMVLCWGLSWSSAAAEPRRGGTLTMAIRKDLTLMNPMIDTKSTDQSIRDLIFESLVGLDSKGKIQPNLAASWEISKDGKLFTFHLRKNVKFHDGREMTAEDVKFSMNYTMNPKNAAYGYAKLKLVDKVEVTDKYTLKVTLKKFSLAFLPSLSSLQAFSVIPKESIEEGITRSLKFPPGTGPFKFVEWRPRQRIVFERFEGYWGHKPFLDRVVLRPIRSGTVRVTALRAGDVDMIERTAYEWVKIITEGKIKGISYVTAPYAGFRGIEFNVAAPPFDNKKLRQAVAYTIDRSEILQAAYFGFGDPIDQKYPKGHVWYLKGIPFPTRNLEKAKELLKESGYKGQTIKIMLTQGETAETEATTIQAQLKKIGMKVKLEVLEYGAYTARQRAGNFEFKVLGGDFDADIWPTYGPYLMCVPDLKKRSNNNSGYCDKEMDDLLIRAQTETDAKIRRGLFRQVLTKVAEDVPYIFVGFVPRFFSFRNYVKGFTTDGDGAFRPWGRGLNYTWLDKLDK